MSKIHNMYNLIPKEYLKDSEHYNPNQSKGLLVFPFRCAIIGGSRSFKTNTALNIIMQSECFERFYLIAKNTTEPLYKYLIDTMTALGNKMRCEMITVSENINDVPDLTEIDTTKQNLIIVDDMIMEDMKKAKKLNEMMTRGRKSNCSIIIISQSYFALPKLIRLNCNYFILKKINSKTDIKSIVSNFSLDKTADEVYNMYIKSTVGVNFFLIDIDTQDPNMRYRMNFNDKLTSGTTSTNAAKVKEPKVTIIEKLKQKYKIV